MRWIALYLCPAFAFTLSYQVYFTGLNHPDALQTIRNSSSLVSLQKTPPPSLAALRYRIEKDLPKVIRILRAFGYYEGEVSYTLKSLETSAVVTLLIEPGPQYTLQNYEVYQGDCKQLSSLPHCPPWSLQQLGLRKGSPAVSLSILRAEQTLLTQLSHCGYPLATIEKRRVEVDMKDKTMQAAACIAPGPVSAFGPTSLFGLKKTDPEYVLKKIAWKEGALYNTELVEKTQKRLLDTQLFSSVMVSHANTLDDEGELPMKLILTEAKYRQISLGGFYATVDGFGGSLRWTLRNLQGVGEEIAFSADISQRTAIGSVLFKKPDLWIQDQTYRAFLGIQRDDIRPYTAFRYSAENYLDRKIDLRRSCQIGLKLEHVNISQSASNGTFLLLGLPVLGKYTTTRNPLNPIHGYTIVYQAIPFQSLLDKKALFIKQILTTSCYLPLFSTDRVILALRGQMGSIVGSNPAFIPLTELFLGGSEDDLRGYRYKTVSPLNANGQPLGGRSALFATIEARFRVIEQLGIVPFADFGTVQTSPLPNLDTRWLKSLGIGIRYFAFFGPLRLDVGFPLDRRTGLDPAFRIYAAVGQSF